MSLTDTSIRKQVVETGVPKVSPLSLVLFAIDLGGVFRLMKAEMEGCMTTLFADNCGWLVTTDSIE